jgi:intracellular sulfur oxidation DsrE/DsrF family protein
MANHQVADFANGLSAKLATRSRHVCAFLGAGTSSAAGLPTISQLVNKVQNGLSEVQNDAFQKQLAGRDLEQVLSRLRSIRSILADDSQQIDGLTGQQAADLDVVICQQIVKALDIKSADLSPILHFAKWVASAEYHLPLEIFTVNYDLLIETALDKLAVPYFDGFVGTLRSRFRTDLVEAAGGSDDSLPSFLARIWKLHGSVHWAWDNGPRTEVVRLGGAVTDLDPAAIYPSDEKYSESRRVPFVVLQDRFRRALNHPESLILISGYSFADAHLNELIFDAAIRRPRSEIIVFCFDNIPQNLADHAETSRNIQVVAAKEAILGGIRAPWEPPDDTSQSIWNQNGLTLVDFKYLGHYLAQSSPNQFDLNLRLKESLESLPVRVNG